MQVSNISSSSIMSMLGTGSTQQTPPPPLEEALGSDIMSSLDTDGDGSLSVTELGKYADKLSDADTNGDGLISEKELVAKLKEKMEEMGMTPPPPPPDGEKPDFADILSKIDENSSTDSTSSTNTTDKTGEDLVNRLLTQLGFSTDEAESFMSMLQNNGVSVLG
jgi:hypothetical protein